MIDIRKHNNLLLLTYSPQNGVEWIYDDHFDKDEDLTIRQVFHVCKSDIYIDEENKYPEFAIGIQFIIGKLENDFYVIPARFLSLKNNLLIHKDAQITSKYFGCNLKNNIMRQLEEIVNSQIIIGGNYDNSIPIDAFNTIIKQFPNNTEKRHYVNMRIDNIISEYVDATKNYGKIYNQYLEKKHKKTNISNTVESVKNYEKEKYSFILERLKNMLKKSDGYSENQWQDKIIEIITLIYPKYLFHIPKLRIQDTIQENKHREIDIALFDENGSIDIIEIKTPQKLLLTNGLYRDNYVPTRELTGAIMQLEKYVYHLNRIGLKGEKHLTEKYKNELRKFHLDIHITNPKGLIIAGRSNNWNFQQQLDFEVIKRKYAHIIDIITYDDLVRRLENLIEKFSH